MKQTIAIYTASITHIPFLESGRQFLVFFGFTLTGRSVLLKVSNFQPHVILYPNQEDILSFGDINYLEYAMEQVNISSQLNISKIDTCLKTDISKGFSNMSKDILIRVYFNNDMDKYNIIEQFKTIKMLGNIKIDEIIHEEIRTIQLFMYEKKIQLQTWVEIDNFQYLDPQIAHCINIDIDSFKSTIFKSEIYKDKPLQPNVCYIRGFARSSLSTKLNQCKPNSSKDPLQIIVYQLNNNEPQILCVGSNCKNEKTMIETFGCILHNNNIHVIVFASDEILLPNVLMYISKRAKITYAHFTFSKIKNHIDLRKNKKTDEMYLAHSGLERLDLYKVLQKAICKPMLIEFTLLHAVRHINLIKRNEALFSKLYDRNYKPPNQFTDSLQMIAQDLVLFVRVMNKLMNEKGFLPNILTTSREHDVEISNIVERGSQNRIYSCFLRDWYLHDLYQHPKANNSYMVAKKNEDSSFVFPPHLENPDLDILFSKKDTQLVQQSNTNFTNIFASKKNGKNCKKIVIKKEQKTYSGGLVLEPIAGEYRGPEKTIATLDWAAMYPNIMISNNICILTECRDSKWTQDPKATIQYVSRNSKMCDVRVIAYDNKPVFTFLPRVVAKFLSLREHARSLKEAATDQQEQLAHAMSEISLKGGANSAYGYFGSSTSKITSFALASCVTQIGQYMQKTVRYKILIVGGAVLYGDTDSCFACFHVPEEIHNTKDKDLIVKYIVDQASKVTTEATNFFQPFNKIIVETYKQNTILLATKKTYMALENGKKIIKKGLGSIKRDKCGLARQIGEYVAEELVKNDVVVCGDYINYLDKKLDLIPWNIIDNNLDLEPFILSAGLASKYTNDKTLSLHISKLLELENGFKCDIGDRLSYVIAYFDRQLNIPHNQQAVPVITFLKNKKLLDVGYYLNVQIYGVLKQILSLPQHNKLLMFLKKRIDIMYRKWQFHIYQEQFQPQFLKRQCV